MATLTRLRQVRELKALTQQQLADRAGVNRVTIARLEGAHDRPFPTTVRKLADALEVEPEDLFAGESREPSSGGEDAGVDRLLRRAPELAAVAREAMTVITRFIPDARLRLDRLADPDDGEGDQLFLGIVTEMPEADALDALRRFDREWWVHNARRAGGLLCIDLDSAAIGATALAGSEVA